MKEFQPLVSVIINCYNGEEFLENAIDSIYAQTYKNWEIIFWDNSSTDQSAKIALSYDKRLRYFQSNTDEPLPIYEAKSLAVEKASGDFIAFLDCDDWWKSSKLEKQLPLFENPSVGFVFGNYWLENERNGTRKIVSQRIQSSKNILDDLLQSYTIGLLTLVIRSSAYHQLEKGFDSRFTVMGDYDVVLRLSASWKANFIEEPIAHYRWHGDNLSTKNPQRSIDELEDWYQLMKKNVMISSSKEFFNIPIIINYSRAMFFMKNSKKKEGLKIITKIPFLRKEFFRLLIVLLLPKKIIDILAR